MECENVLSRDAFQIISVEEACNMTSTQSQTDIKRQLGVIEKYYVVQHGFYVSESSPFLVQIKQRA